MLNLVIYPVLNPVRTDKVCSMKMMKNKDNVESSLLTSIY